MSFLETPSAKAVEAVWPTLDPENKDEIVTALARLIARRCCGTTTRRKTRTTWTRRCAMSENAKVSATHLRRRACVYVRQSTSAQVEHNRESTERQYRLVERAASLGWQSDQVVVIDDDLGVSGGGLVERVGFARLTSDVALGHVGIVLGLEVSRLARNNADWYRLLDLCGVTDTLIGDADGIYHPGLFNDRLVLGLKGTMSEA